jgi:hypothetical protein
LQTAVAKRLQKLQNCKREKEREREREREGNVHGHKSNKKILKKKRKRYIPSKHHQNSQDDESKEERSTFRLRNIHTTLIRSRLIMSPLACLHWAIAVTGTMCLLPNKST